MCAQEATEQELAQHTPSLRLATAGLPPLEDGDRLARDEFERRYNVMPRINKAELVEGIVHMPSPVRYDKHALPHAFAMGWLAAYAAATPGTGLGDNATVRLDMDNEVQPDALLRLEPAAGGSSRVGRQGYVEGAPELVVEIASSSVAIDLHDKLRVYRRTGVREYIVWRVQDEQVDWFVLSSGDTERLSPDTNGLVCSRVFPGLCLNVPALLRGDLAAVLADLQKSLQSPEHAAFVAELAEAEKPVASSGTAGT
jgi:Uma2 family endonuclease